MSLSERIAATKCAVVACDYTRVPDSLFCKDGGHLNDYWNHKLARNPDGRTFVPVRQFAARDETGRITA